MSVPLLHSSGTNDEKSMSHPTIATDLWPMDHLSNLQNENLMTANQESKPESHLDDPNYFEGDLDISNGMIDVYYNNSYEKHEKRRFSKAIRRDKDMLWPQGIIYYSFHSSINSITQNVILEAIHEIERQTCLQFQPHRHRTDHIEFTGEGDACLSSIGKVGGKQLVRLPDTSVITCRTRGIALHEILHALGVWHEQSRPDRNGYVQVLVDNIQSGKERNFNTRSNFEVDYHGERYDYGSIMHYPLDGFSSNNNPTLKVIDIDEYIRQGRPTIGQRQQLSKSDISQLNRMYNCPGSGIAGNLDVYIKYGRGLPKSGQHCVKISAVDDSRQRVARMRTRYILRNERPKWNQWISFGERTSWQYLEISVWNNDGVTENQITDVQTFSVSPGYHKSLRYCGNESCSVRVYFAYNLTSDSNEYSPDQCISSNPCRCKPEINGRLRVYVRYGNLVNTTSSNPYVEVIAYNHNGNSTSLQTADSTGENETVEWNQWLDFGVDTWIRFKVEVYDEHIGGAELLSNTTTYYLSSHISYKYARKKWDNGYIYFDYHFQLTENNTTWMYTNCQVSSTNLNLAQIWALCLLTTLFTELPSEWI